MTTAELIYKIWQKSSIVKFTSEHLVEECYPNAVEKDWKEIKKTFEALTKAYRELEALLLAENQYHEKNCADCVHISEDLAAGTGEIFCSCSEIDWFPEKFNPGVNYAPGCDFFITSPKPITEDRASIIEGLLTERLCPNCCHMDEMREDVLDSGYSFTCLNCGNQEVIKHSEINFMESPTPPSAFKGYPYGG